MCATQPANGIGDEGFSGRMDRSLPKYDMNTCIYLSHVKISRSSKYSVVSSVIGVSCFFCVCVSQDTLCFARIPQKRSLNTEILIKYYVNYIVQSYVIKLSNSLYSQGDFYWTNVQWLKYNLPVLIMTPMWTMIYLQQSSRLLVPSFTGSRVKQIRILYHIYIPEEIFNVIENSPTKMPSSGSATTPSTTVHI